MLNKVHLVPDIQKNPISVQKFYKNNSVHFEFHNSFFLGKDYSGIFLHKGPNNGGLYSFSVWFSPIPSNLKLFQLCKSLFKIGIDACHASTPIVSRIVSRLTLSVTVKNKNFECPSCQQAKICQLTFKNFYSTSRFSLFRWKLDHDIMLVF